MKKIFLAFFMAVLMILLPVSISAQTHNVKTYDKNLTVYEEVPKFFITPEEKIVLNDYIEKNYQDENKDEAYDIVNDIISSDLEVDMISLSRAIEVHNYQPIPEEKLSTNMTKEQLNELLDQYWGVKDGVFTRSQFGGLIGKILNLIKGRLGWFYDFFSEGISLFVEGVRLTIDFITLPIVVVISLVSIVNEILSIPFLMAKLIRLLFQLKLNEFLNTLIDFVETLGQDFVEFLNAVKQLFKDIIDVTSYLQQVIDFVNWVNSEPWKHAITVTGSVHKNLLPLADATISCQNQTTKTNSEGEFSFSVQPQPGEHSIPSNEWYGMHRCVISISKDGEILKKSLPILSYVFSGGEIKWDFLVWKARSKDNLDRPVLKIMDVLFQKIQIFFNDFLKMTDISFNRITPLSI